MFSTNDFLTGEEGRIVFSMMDRVTGNMKGTTNERAITLPSGLDSDLLQPHASA